MLKLGQNCIIIKMTPKNDNKKDMKNDFKQTLNEAIEKINERAQNEIYDTQYYRNINETFNNTGENLFARAFQLEIEQDDENKSEHILRVYLLHPTMELQSCRPLAIGSKAKILEYLNDKNFVNKLANTLNDMSEKMQDR